MAIRIFDDATKKALLGLLPMAPGATINVTLDCFLSLPEAARPVFRLRDFTAEQFQAMRAEVNTGVGVSLQTMIKTLQEGALASWDNLPDSAFNEIAFSKEAISTLPPRWIEALYWMAAKLCSPNKLERESLERLPLPTSDTLSKAAPSADAAQG